MENPLNITATLRKRLPHLSEDELNELVTHVISELEKRVGERLAKGLTDAQLDEFDQIVQSGDDAAANKWLETVVPNNQDIVREVAAQLVDQVVETVTTSAASTESDGAPHDEEDDLEHQDSASTRPPASDGDVEADGEDKAAIRLHNWQELRHHLHSHFICRLIGDDQLSIAITLPEKDRSQMVFVRHINDKWAEVSSGIGRALEPDAVSTALNALARNIGVGAAAEKDLLIARHGLPYEGLTVASAFRSVLSVAHAADGAEQAATGGDEF